MYINGRRKLSDIADNLGITVKTLCKHFDALEIDELVKSPLDNRPINLLLNTTFFGREYGYFCFHDTHRIIYFKEVVSESVAELETGLLELKRAGYRFASITLDGRRGFIQKIKKMFPSTPVQMCHFHQKAIVRRYITNKPKTECGQDLKHLMTQLSKGNGQGFIDVFDALSEKHHDFLQEKNQHGKFMHTRLRSAFRSLKTNMPYLFIYQKVSGANIPNTTNQLEGLFAHPKERVKIHREMDLKRKKKAIKFFLSKC